MVECTRCHVTVDSLTGEDATGRTTCEATAYGAIPQDHDI